ncbi:hypothetical protein IT575_01880 [bacterium]|nr:hypothetical protein [bacterium]
MPGARIQRHLEAYYDFFGQPVAVYVRILLFVAIFALVPVFRGPLWTMAFTSNQYPEPLAMEIWVNKLEGQKTETRDDLREINSLNHYIGMKPLMESDFAEFTWLPFCIGVIALLTLRVAALGRLRDLVDVFMVYTYFGLFGLWTFYNKLHSYGHNLDPEASIKVDPFMPPVYGTVKIANFTVSSYPGEASYWLGTFAGLLALALFLAALRAWKDLRSQLKSSRQGA